MSQPALLDFDALLAPIAEAQPCGIRLESGENAQLTSAFSELRALASIARAYEKNRYEQGGDLPTDESSAPKWDRIATLSIDILTKYSKDTRAMVNLIEALSHLQDLTGMRDAFKACALLIDKYQLNLFPLTEPGEVPHYCLEFIGKICESETYHLKSAIYSAEIFSERPGYSWSTYIEAVNLEKRLEKLSSSEKAELLQRGTLTLENFAAAVAEIRDLNAIREFEERVEEALAQATVLDGILTQYSDRRVGITRILDDLAQLQRWYRGLVEDRVQALVALAPQTPLEEAGSQTMDGGSNASSMQDSGNAMKVALGSREQALGSLLQVAAFFRKTEPHSPLSYALEQAVRWGKMPLPDLLRDLVSNDEVLQSVYQRMGIQEKPTNSDD